MAAFLIIMRYRSVFVSLSIAFTIISCVSQDDKEHDTADGLYTLPGLNHGLIQSPINILTNNLEDAGKHQIEVSSVREDVATAVVNKGHTIELEFEPGTEVLFDGNSYDFIQAHFHTPSEHQIDGMTFPMEMHFVCMHKESDQQKPRYLVFAAFFKMGEENKFINGFINKIPEHENDTTSLVDSPVFVEDLIGDINPDRKYYYYRGSLTTPPYTETVNWLILREIIQASPEQIKIINDLEGNNARHVQASFGRSVESN